MIFQKIKRARSPMKTNNFELLELVPLHALQADPFHAYVPFESE